MSIFCNACGTKLPENSKFCFSCGAKVATEEVPTHDNTSSKEEKTDKSKKETLLWDKFAEIYDSTDDERKRYEDLSSEEVWELIQRISTNSFESFIENNKDLLNKQPYKVIESLKNVFTWCATGGYWFWMAESLLKDERLKRPKDIALNHFIKEWQEIIGKDYAEYSKDFSEELTQAMSTFFEWEIKNVLNSADSVRELPNELIENLKSALLIQIIWGYLGGVTEKKYRK